MSESSNQVIRINIEIPMLGGNPVIQSEVVGGAGAARKPGQERVSVLTVFHPNDLGPVPVKSTNGTTGVICATGRAPLDDLGNPPVRVTACIFEDPTTVPAAYPTCGTEAQHISGEGDWEILELGTAACGGSGSLPTNKFVVWYEYSNGLITREITVFEGECSSSTICEEDDEVLSRRTVFPPIAPPVWRVDAQGFYGKEVERLNGEAELLLETGGCTKTMRWGGSNRQGVSVRLILRGTIWTLMFKFDDFEVRYTHEAYSWNPMGINTFQSVSSSGLPPRAAVPAAVIVTPASV